ncbi:MAG TPA: hypothetical protein VH682_15785 [Gemmataceae bacterium]|jgi:hypothetical protein
MSSASPTSVLAYSDFLGHLVPVLTASGPDSPVVANLVQFGKQQFPGRAADLDFLVGTWREMQGTGSSPASAPPGSGNPRSSVGTWVARGGTLTAGALVALVLSNWGTVSMLVQNLHITLSSPWVLLAVIAVAGAVGGFLNGYLADSGTVLPRRQELGGDRYFLPGLLGNAAAGALAAGLTVWAPTWAVGATAGGTPAMAQPVVLTSAIVASAFMAGFGAARMVTGQRDKNLLWYAVEKALRQPSRPETARKVGDARSARDVVAMTTGEMLPGARVMPTAAPVPGSAAHTAELLRHFQGDSLRQFFDTAVGAGRSAVLTRDTQDLLMSTLNVVQGFGGPLRDAVRELRLVDVAGSSLDDFRGRLAATGVDVTTLGPTIEAIWNAAHDAKAALDHMPPDGHLTPTQLG